MTTLDLINCKIEIKLDYQIRYFFSKYELRLHRNRGFYYDIYGRYYLEVIKDNKVLLKKKNLENTL